MGLSLTVSEMYRKKTMYDLISVQNLKQCCTTSNILSYVQIRKPTVSQSSNILYKKK